MAVALPLPVLWASLGYGLREAWPYPLAVAIGDGVTATVPLLCGIFEMHPLVFQLANWPSAFLWGGVMLWLGTTGVTFLRHVLG